MRRHDDERPAGAAGREPRPAAPRSRPLLTLQATAGNRAVAAALSRTSLPVVVQREIVVGTETYQSKNDSARDFRRRLMLFMHKEGYRETGTTALWKHVDRALSGADRLSFPGWKEMLTTFVTDGLLDKPLPTSGIPTGPRGLGRRPKWSPATAVAIKEARGGRKGLAARHVLASSTLGLAVEKATADLTALNAWLTKWKGGPRKDVRSAKQAVWTTVHNFAGNLWMGESQANTAIGFVRGPLNDIKSKIPEGARGVDVAALRQIVKSKLVVGGADTELNRTWNILIGDLEAELGEMGDFASREDVEELIDMYYRNADIDLPPLADDEYDHVLTVWQKLQEPATVLDGLDLFMSRPLQESIAPA